MNLFRLKASLMSDFIKTIREKKKNALEVFIKAMWKLAIIKFTAVMVAFIVMMVFFFTHLNGFAPITLQFSKWVSSSFIGFFIFIMIIKFVAVSIGLTVTILTVKKTTIEIVLLRFKESCKLRLSVFLRKKVQPQIT